MNQAHCGIEIYITKTQDGDFDYLVAVSLGDGVSSAEYGSSACVGKVGFSTYDEACLAAVEAGRDYLPGLMSEEELEEVV